ncbi:MAG: CoA-transferase [Natronomonas sp.]
MVANTAFMVRPILSLVEVSMTLTDAMSAIANGLADGDELYLAGFGHLVPFALAHEIIRQDVRDLVVTKPIVDTLLDQLVCAGCVSKARFSWTHGTCFERAWRAGDLEIEEYTHYGTIALVHAGARNLPYLPVRSFAGSDLVDHNDELRFVEDPYDGELLPTVPSLQPDVTVLHGCRADRAGNVQIRGLSTDVRDAAYAAETVIASVEEIVDRETIKRDPNLTVVPETEVDYLVEEPYGAHPSYAQGYYDIDREVFEWMELAESDERAKAWLDEWVYGVADRSEYVEKLGQEYFTGIHPDARRASNSGSVVGSTDEESDGSTDSSHVEYTNAELMVVTAAREIRDGESVMVGLGLPSVASNLAKRTHAPDIQQVYEAGIVGAEPRGTIPYGVAGPELVDGATSAVPMIDVFGSLLQGGHLDVGFLGGAQVDRYGNINSTVIGEYNDPEVRLPGSGGACTIACNAGRTMIIMPHEPRRFPERVDFVTSPGYLDEDRSREDLGLRGGGPELLITDKAVFRFDENGEAYVDSLHPRVDRAEIQDATGWDVRFAPDVGRTPTPDQEELRLIRKDIDPEGTYMGEE